MPLTSSQLDPGAFGRSQDDLPPFDQGPLDLHAFFNFPKPSPEKRSAEGPDHPAHATTDPPRPLELEIGSGKGTFLVQQAAATPGVDYLGIEYARAYYRYAADRIRRHGLPNARMLHAEAGQFIRNYVPDAALRQVHIYFPDPWPKKRHHKRRFVQESNLRDLHRTLVPRDPADPLAGRIRIATDHADYFEWMQEHAARVADLYERLPFDPPASAGEGELVGTNFERKYRRQGRPFHALILQRLT